LTWDGKAGPATLKALGIQSNDASSSTNADVELLARLISAESRGEPYSGQVAVGAVVLNRVKHPSFPNTLSGVVYQSGAFSCIGDGQFYEPIDQTCYRAARDALNGVDPFLAVHCDYYNPNKATSSWIWSRTSDLQ
jgi:N-acetylmuramoyl-L-alanine amidase